MMRFVAKVSRRIGYLPVVALLSAGIDGCIFQSPSISALDVKSPPVVVQSPVKAHLLDGSTVVFPAGVNFSGNQIVGAGLRYAIGSTGAVGVSAIPIDSIVGMEAYDKKINMAATVAATTATAAVGTVAGIVLLKAIFGSCPTFYADSAGVELLQGEGFSYSMAPLLEQRDVDRLRLTPDANGRIVMNVRNEALETHYINHLEVLEIAHGTSELIVPDQAGRPLALSNTTTPISARDRSGRDVSQTLAAADNVVFSTNEETLDQVKENDLDDWIDLEIPAPSSADSVAVMIDMRNSLLNTVLLYDHILAAPGIKSLDFLGKDLENISSAVEMAKWYTSHMGMRVSVLDGTSWRPVVRIGDSGPIAFHQLAVMVPAIRNGGKSVHVRLAFVADDWRIDAIRTTGAWRRPASRRIPVARVAMSDPSQNASAFTSLSVPDENYLVTSPGQSFKVEFEAGKLASESRTFMLASQGYYTEWVRGSWIKSASGKPFTPTSASLLSAIRGWRAQQPEMERKFYSTRIATR